MSVLDRIASSLGQRSGKTNHALAQDLARKPDPPSIRVLLEATENGSARVASDCLEVLEEVGKLDPRQIAPYAERFVALLQSKNNRQVWGAMGSLSSIAHSKAAVLEPKLDTILRAMENGSVITVDYAVSVLAEVAAARKTARPRVERVLLSHLKSCRPKEVAQHAERSLPAVTSSNAQRFAKVLQARLSELTDSQRRRVGAVLRRLPGGGTKG